MPAVCSSVDKLDKMSWEDVEKELIEMKGLTKQQTEKIWEFVKRKGSPFEILAEVRELKVFGDHKIANEALDEMELLFNYCQAFGCLNNISFDFSLARGLDYYTGLVYEAVLLEGTQLGSIAGGGRYDNLIGMFSGRKIPAVGVSIGIERMFLLLEEKAKAQNTI